MPGSIQSIERAAAIMRLLSGPSRQVGVVDLANQLGLAKGTVHGLLRTLQQANLVEQDRETSKYQLGPALLHIGFRYLDGNQLRARALNWAESLAAQSGEAVQIGLLHELQVLIIHHVRRPDDNLQMLDVGLLLPAHATALGKVLLAQNPTAVTQIARHALQPLTEATSCNPERLDDELARVREQGWAVSIGELRPEQVSIAAPILDTAGRTAGAIGISGASYRLLDAGEPRSELVAQVLDAALCVSRQFSGTAPA